MLILSLPPQFAEIETIASHARPEFHELITTALQIPAMCSESMCKQNLLLPEDTKYVPLYTSCMDINK